MVLQEKMEMMEKMVKVEPQDFVRMVDRMQAHVLVLSRLLIKMTSLLRVEVLAVVAAVAAVVVQADKALAAAV